MSSACRVPRHRQARQQLGPLGRRRRDRHAQPDHRRGRARGRGDRPHRPPRSRSRCPSRQDGVQTGMIPGRVNPLHTMVADQPGDLRPRHRRHQRRRGDHGAPGGHPLGRPHPCLALGPDLQRPPRRHDHRARRRASSAASTRPRTSSRAAYCSTWPRAQGVDRLPGDHAVTPEDLDAAEEFGRDHGPRRRHRPRPHRADPDVSGGRQARVRLSVARPVGAHARVVPRARCGRGRERHPHLRDLPAGDREPLAAGARPRPGRNGHAPGPELESGGLVHSLCTRGRATRSCCRRCPSPSSAAPAHPWPRSRSCRAQYACSAREFGTGRRCDPHRRPAPGARALLPRPLGEPAAAARPALAEGPRHRNPWRPLATNR